MKLYFFEKFKSFFDRDFFKNPIVFFLLLAILILNLASFIILTIFIEKSSSPVILHYNVYFGVDLIGDWWQIYIMPAMGLFFALVNLFLALYFYGQKERIASYCLMLASFIIEAGILISSILIALINY
ncbi:MAG: hypothetical protein M0P97_03690 [Candidatus Moranbacteria bacterium]|nr:hypothetical protein [Candidatus Moranbacteria bacterium]